MNTLRPLDYMSSKKTYFRFTMSERMTRSNSTMRDPKEHMNELYEEQSKGEWCTSALPCFDSFGEIDLSRPCRIKTGVHSVDSSVPGSPLLTKPKSRCTMTREEVALYRTAPLTEPSGLNSSLPLTKPWVSRRKTTCTSWAMRCFSG